MITQLARLLILLAVAPTVSPGFAAAAEQDATPAEIVTASAKSNRSRLDFDGANFSGPAWQRLLAEGQHAQFFLIGEEHGIAENPQLAARLFEALTDHGYRKLVIEVSPPMARLLDDAASSDGINGLKKLYAQPGGEPAFFGMREEAQMLAAVRAALPKEKSVFWGVDYEVAGDRPLLRQLQNAPHNQETGVALDNLLAASATAWERYYETGSPQNIFSFSGKPALVQAVKDSWLSPNGDVQAILQTLQSTLEINQLWVQGRGWESNARRAALIRNNFLDHWHAARKSGESPRLMAKLGASHLMRGLNMNGVFDLGTLLAELAAAEGVHSFSILVLPGSSSMTAVLNPSTWTYEAKPAKDGYARGIAPLTAAAYPDTFTLIDLTPIRAVVRAGTGKFGPDLVRIVHGFDMVLVMSGSTAAAELAHH